jgi:sigma-B regulation protein RsbU (phosphoserine phosphatase)
MESIERAQSALDNTILRINHVLQSVEITLHNLSWQVVESLNQPDKLYTITEHIIQSNDFISGSAIAFVPYYYEQEGRYYSPYSYREDGAIRSKQLGSSSYDYHTMDWYRIPCQLSVPYWSEPYYDEGGGNIIMTTYSYPIYNHDGSLVAIFTADLSLEWFAEMVNSIKPYPNAYNLMIGRGGAYLVHYNSEYILNETLSGMAQARGDVQMVDTAQRMIGGEQGIGEFEREGERFYLLYAPIEATGWSVAVACLHSDIFAGVESVRKYSYIAGIICLLLVAVICFITIRRMTRPLIKIAGAATEIANGNLLAELPEISGDDEMCTLHDSFANMQQSLLKYVDELQLTAANKERIESELRIARAIQMDMVPKVFPPFPEREDVDLYSQLKPAREVGGDLYDFFIADEKLHFIIGDVAGKGVPASLVMAVTCRLYRTIANNVATPEGIVSTLNDALSESNDSNMFCTAFVGILDLKSGELRYCNAGHNPPIVLRSSGDVEALSVVPNLAMGIWQGFEYRGESCMLDGGSTLFMYTDGVTEAESDDKELYGEQRLMSVLKRHTSSAPRHIVDALLEDIAHHVGGADQTDDITMLCCSLGDLRDREGCRRIVLRNNIEEIARMQGFIDELVAELCLTTEDAFNIHLALEEAVSNVIMYAFPEGEQHDITLAVRHVDDTLIFRVIDAGREFDPTLQPDADVTLSLEQRPIGGLGIFLIRRIMQRVEYHRIDGNNILTMVKSIEAE